MPSVVLALLVAAAPFDKALPDLPAPLGALSSVVTEVPAGGVKAGERRVTVSLPGCARAQAVHASRYLASTLHALAQVQSWVDQTEGLEAWLFGTRGRLGEVAKLAAGSAPTDERQCAVATLDGWRLSDAKAGPRKCRLDPSAPLGDHWWVHAEKPAAVVWLAGPPRGAKDACQLRLSAALFDQTGRARFRYHADLDAAPRATVVGDDCKTVELEFDAASGAFKAKSTQCKR